MTTEISKQFDYELMEREDAQYVRQRAEEVRAMRTRAVSDIAKIAEVLSEVKEKLPHGSWLPWLQAEFGWSVRTAQRLMRIRNALQMRPVSHLNMDTSSLYLLTADSTPQPVKERVRERARSGERIRKQDVQKEIQEERRREEELPPERPEHYEDREHKRRVGHSEPAYAIMVRSHTGWDFKRDQNGNVCNYRSQQVATAYLISYRLNPADAAVEPIRIVCEEQEPRTHPEEN